MHFLNRMTAATVVGALLFATFCFPAAASEVDSWGGQVFLRHHTDVFAWPHRALEFPNTASLVYVPPTTSESDFRAVPSYEIKDVAGALTVGKSHWQAILGANVPHAANPVMYHGMGMWRGWGRGLVGGGMLGDALTAGFDYSDADPRPKMQIGGAYQVNEDLRVGATVQQLSHVWTETVKDDTDPSVTEGYEISGNTFGFSAGLGDVGPLSSLEGTFVFGSSERDEFREQADADSVITPGMYGGNGETSTFSFAGLGTIEDVDWITTRLPMDFNVYGRFDNGTSDYTYNQDPDDDTPEIKQEWELSGFDFRAGFSNQNHNAFAVSLGFMSNEFTETGTDDYGTGVEKMEEKLELTIFPYCDCAGTVEIGKGFALQWGVAAGWQNVETTGTYTDTPDVGDPYKYTEIEKDESLFVAYSVGGRFRVNDHFNVTGTFNTDYLGNPGAIVFGDAGSDNPAFSRDTPITVLGAQIIF